MKSFLAIMKKVEKVSMIIGIGCMIIGATSFAVATVANGINDWRW